MLRVSASWPFIAASGAAAFALVGLVGWWSYEDALNELRNAEADIVDAVEAVETRIRTIHEVVTVALAQTPNISQTEFDALFAPIVREPDFAGLRAIAYAPRVAADGLEAFLDANGARARRGERARAITITPAFDDRAIGYPADLYAPMKGNERVYGFDLWADPARRAAAERAIANRATKASAPVRLSQDAAALSSSMLFVTPVFTSDQAESPDAFVASGFTIGPRFAGLDRAYDTHGVAVRIVDVGAIAQAPSVEQSIFRKSDVGSCRLCVGRSLTTEFAGRVWRIDIEASLLSRFDLRMGTSVAAALLLAYCLFAIAGRLRRLAVQAGALRERLTRNEDDLAKSNMELSAALDRAEEAARAKDRFIAHLSHDLRTPLNGIAAACGLLTLTGPSAPTTEKRAEYVGDIARSAKTLSQMIDDLLNISALQRQQIEPRFAVADLRSVLAGVCRAVLDASPRRDVQLTQDVPEQPLMARTDAHLIWRVLANLVDNAVKYAARPGRVTAVMRRSADGYAVVTVCDDGPGFPSARLANPAELLLRDSDPFVQSQQGFGLGLAIVQEISRLLDVTVTFANGSNGGAEVAIALKCIENPPDNLLVERRPAAVEARS